VVTREARRGEQSRACAREGGRYQVSCNGTEKEACAPIGTEGTVNDAQPG
jgi:hypothetical protein